MKGCSAPWRRVLPTGPGSKMLFWAVMSFVMPGGVSLAQAQNVVINEFLAVNDGGLADSDGEFPDWIEIHNREASPVSLLNWSLTDDPAQLQRWRFPAVNIPASGYLVVFASGKNRMSGQFHTNFKLDGDGEFLALVKPDGVTVASQFTPRFPNQRRNISYGVGADAGLHYLRTPSPGAANGSNYVEFVADTKFSVDRGFYGGPVSVVITTATASATIYYTTNGSAPSPTNGFIYTAPVLIGRTTVLKAAALKSGFEPSNVDTHTYLFLSDVVQQDFQKVVERGFPTNWGATAADYGLDPEVVGPADLYGGKYRSSLSNDLRSLPSVCLGLPVEEMFGANGIYTRSDQMGDAWERPVSFEVLYPDGRKSVKATAGVRIQGGFFRLNFVTLKHSFRIAFRERYGPGKLKEPLIGPKAADEFDTLVLRAGANDAYSWQPAAGQPLYVRDSFIRQTMLDMNAPAARDFFVHLYINGVYWGLYDLTERPDAAFAESYFGGVEEDWDALNDNGVSNGSNAAWTNLLSLCSQGLANDAAYQRVQGNNPDGTRNAAYPNYLDVDNVIDYLIALFYGGTRDWPAKNYWLLRHQTNNTGFKYMAWDMEMCLGLFLTNVTINTTTFTNDVAAPYGAARANAEFRLRFADRAHKHLFNGGALYVDPAQPQWDPAHPERNRAAARLAGLAAQIDGAMVAESARWGDQHVAVPYTRDEHWRVERNWLLSQWIPNRWSNVIEQFRAAGLYPNVVAPGFSQHGGAIAPGFQLAIAVPAGSIYYTVNGGDPRQTNQATLYSGPVSLAPGSVVKARALSGGEWSALNEALFTAARQPLIITEIHYHPADPTIADRNAGFDDADQFEFLEFLNSGTDPIALTNLRLTNAVRFSFGSVPMLAPGAVALVVKSAAAFVQRYGTGLPVVGEYDGNLSNGGENLLLLDGGRTVLDISYGTEPPWPAAADGAGSSLELLDWRGDFNAATNWRASLETHGTPGRVEGAVLRIETARVEGQHVILQFTARAGVRYTLAFKPALEAANWIPLNEFPPAAAPGSREYDDLIPAGTAQRYYRISSEE
jgi:CotH protein/chitobiase/beta-hexosaminidase-like protein/lamin tail-like protein/Fn3 domain-containing protein